MHKKKLIVIFSSLLIICISLFSLVRYINSNDNVQLTQSEIESKLKELENSIYEDGTYNLNTMKQISYNDGYQVSFYQIGDNYSDNEYNKIVKRFLNESTDNIISAGKFNGETEISFNIKDKQTAIKLAKEFNQISIWDWSNDNSIETGGTGKNE